MALTASQKRTNERLMRTIIRLLAKHNMFQEVHLFINGREYASEAKPGATALLTNHIPYYDYGPKDVSKTVEYANPDALTITFEGELYHAYNGFYHSSIVDELQAAAAKYHMYFEQGYAWSTACWPE